MPHKFTRRHKNVCPECGGAHPGPHYLYADDLWKKINAGLLTTIEDTSLSIGKREVAYFAFCQEEHQRLAEKLRQMRKHQRAQE